MRFSKILADEINKMYNSPTKVVKKDNNQESNKKEQNDKESKSSNSKLKELPKDTVSIGENHNNLSKYNYSLEEIKSRYNKNI